LILNSEMLSSALVHFTLGITRALRKSRTRKPTRDEQDQSCA